MATSGLALSNLVPRSCGAWQHEQNIQVLEAWALVISLWRVALILHGREARRILILDNLGVGHCFNRCRSNNLCSSIKYVFSQVVSFARNLKPTVRWVPSEFNNSDEPCRRDDFPSVSHLLTHEFDQTGESTKGCVARNTDTDAYDSGSTAGHVNFLCQPLSCESDLHQNDSSQFDQTVVNFDCDKPVDESNADPAEGGAFCGAAENEVLANTNIGAASRLPSTTRHLATIPSLDTTSAGSEDNARDWPEKRHHQLDRDRSQERDRPAPDIGAAAKQTSSTIPGQRQGKLEAGPHRAGGASGQGRHLGEAVLRGRAANASHFLPRYCLEATEVCLEAGVR